MPSKKMHVSTYLTAEEYAEVKANADRAYLSLSRFLRLTSMGQPVKSLEYEKERMELRALKGTIGQIGGLLKQAIVQDAAPREQINHLLRKLDSCRLDIQTLIRKIGA
uniref:Putative plasmid conjugal transfer protein n=1 Tax=Desulfovibrio desulfuricans (strain ATCC 27774 / DSM 6949 / MB) TaxID=525146 RepID=B8J347_DESDA